jgi:hypothetical protein
MILDLLSNELASDVPSKMLDALRTAAAAAGGTP